MDLLSVAAASERMLLVLRASIVLWLGTLTALLLRADGALHFRLGTNRVLASPDSVLAWYAEWGLFGFYAAGIVLFGHGLRNRRPLFLRVGLAYVLAQGLGTVLLVRLIKIACGRPRPFLGAEAMFCQSPSFVRDFHSFPSSHVVSATVGALFVVLLVRSRAVALLAVAATLLMAVARVATGQHYLSDVLAGLALGTAITAAVLHLYLFPRWRTGDPADTPR